MKTALAARLGDTGKVFFVDAELELYCKEALYNFQALSGYWRDRFTFQTVANTPFYDISAVTGSLLAPSIKDVDLLTQIQYHLIEPVGTTWTGSTQFTLADIVDAMERRRNQFLVETGMVLTQQTLPWPSPPISRAALDEKTIDVRRAVWKKALDNTRTTLWRTDEFAANAARYGWSQNPADPPESYSTAATPPITLQLVPPPAASGTVELLAVQSGASLNPLTGVLLGIPDNFAWVVKWGVLADILSKDGEGYDGLRHAYAERRWEEGIELARLHTSAVQAYVNSIQCPINAVQTLDSMRPNWQDITIAANVGTPDAPALASWNMLALSPVPNGIFGITLDVVRNAPVSSPIQIGREDLDAVLSCAQHIAMFKEGGLEFRDSMYLYRRTTEQAVLYNERIKAAVKYLQPLENRAEAEEAKNPRREKLGDPLYQQQQAQTQ